MKFLSVYLVFLCLWTSSPRRVYCYSLSRGDCPFDYLRCENGENVRGESPVECFQENKLCNNFTDCTDGSDEKYCKHNYNWGSDGYVFRFNQGICPDNFVMCLKHNDESSCIGLGKICDGYEDCNDNSDEFFCPYDPVKGFRFKFEQGHCKNNSYSCSVLSDDANNNDECIDSNMICNGKINCNNHFDETFCPHLEINKLDFSSMASVFNVSEPTLTSTGSANEIYKMETIEDGVTETSILTSNASTVRAVQKGSTSALFRSSTSLISSQNLETIDTPSVTLDEILFHNSSQNININTTEATITVHSNKTESTITDDSNKTETTVKVASNINQENNSNDTISSSSFLNSATGSYLVMFSVIMVFVNTTIIIILILVLVLLYRRTISIKNHQMYAKQEKNHVNRLLNNLSKWDDET